MPPELRVKRTIGFAGELAIEVAGVATADAPVLTYAMVSKALNRYLTERDGEWCGVPMPLPGLDLQLAPGHPLAAQIAEMQRIVDTDEAKTSRDVSAEPAEPADNPELFAEAAHWTVVNHWRGESPSGATGTVTIMRRDDGKVGWFHAPDRPRKNRFLFGPFETMDAWDLDTECTAIEKLATLLTPRMFKAYVLTGQFLETSRRSGLTYFFRRLHPTIVMTPNGMGSAYFAQRAEPDNGMRILVCLCLHPLAYYERTFCGAMCPTDDVIAHLLLMRGDEALYWKRSNHHHPLDPESGL